MAAIVRAWGLRFHQGDLPCEVPCEVQLFTLRQGDNMAVDSAIVLGGECIGASADVGVSAGGNTQRRGGFKYAGTSAANFGFDLVDAPPPSTKRAHGRGHRRWNDQYHGDKQQDARSSTSTASTTSHYSAGSAGSTASGASGGHGRSRHNAGDAGMDAATFARRESEHMSVFTPGQRLQKYETRRRGRGTGTELAAAGHHMHGSTSVPEASGDVSDCVLFTTSQQPVAVRRKEGRRNISAGMTDVLGVIADATVDFCAKKPVQEPKVLRQVPRPVDDVWTRKRPVSAVGPKLIAPIDEGMTSMFIGSEDPTLTERASGKRSMHEKRLSLEETRGRTIELPSEDPLEPPPPIEESAAAWRESADAPWVGDSDGAGPANEDGSSKSMRYQNEGLLMSNQVFQWEMDGGAKGMERPSFETRSLAQEDRDRRDHVWQARVKRLKKAKEREAENLAERAQRWQAADKSSHEQAVKHMKRDGGHRFKRMMRPTTAPAWR